MDRIKFLNQLASTNSQYNFGAGVPPLEMYPHFDPLAYLTFFMESFPSTNIKQYHQTEGFLTELGSEVYRKQGSDFVSSRNLAITNGVQEAISIVCHLFKGKTIACPDPYYPGLVDVAKMLGVSPVFLPDATWIGEISRLPQGSLIYLSADFANPTGKRLDESERIELVKIAQKNDLYIFDDATYREFYLDEPLPSLVSLAPERVIHGLSFSKILSPGLRLAIVYVPDSLMDRFLGLKANLSLNTSGYTQAIVGGWLLKHNFDIQSHLSTFKNELIRKKEILTTNGVEYNGGFFGTLNLSDFEPSFEWCAQLLEKDGVAVCPMSLFSEETSNKNKLRLAVAKISPDQIQTGLQKIYNFVAL